MGGDPITEEAILLAYERIEGWRPGQPHTQEQEDMARSELWEALGDDGRKKIALYMGKKLQEYRNRPAVSRS